MSDLDHESSEPFTSSDESFIHEDGEEIVNDGYEDDMEGVEEQTSAEQDGRSKRQRRLDTIPNPGANEKSKGDVVGESDGSMIWWNADGDAGDGTRGTWGKSHSLIL